MTCSNQPNSATITIHSAIVDSLTTVSATSLCLIHKLSLSLSLSTIVIAIGFSLCHCHRHLRQEHHRKTTSVTLVHNHHRTSSLLYDSLPFALSLSLSNTSLSQLFSPSLSLTMCCFLSRMLACVCVVKQHD